MASNIKVSVIIPTYNCAQYLSDAINSVLNQTISDIEIIVVDDGSTDNTKEIINSCFKEVIYIEQKNAGPASARNAGISRCTGNYIAFLDADDLWLPTKIEKQLALLEQYQEVAMVYTQMINFNGDTGTKSAAHPRMIKSGEIFDHLLRENFIHLPTVILRSSVLSRIGLFDETLPTAEDTNLWLRISKTEIISGIEEPLVLRRIHSHNLSNRVDISMGTLTSLDKIVVLFPETSPHCYEPMKTAYLCRGIALICDYFHGRCYWKSHDICNKLLRLKLCSTKIVFYWVITFLPPSILDLARKIRGKIRAAFCVRLNF